MIWKWWHLQVFFWSDTCTWYHGCKIHRLIQGFHVSVELVELGEPKRARHRGTADKASQKKMTIFPEKQVGEEDKYHRFCRQLEVSSHQLLFLINAIPNCWQFSPIVGIAQSTNSVAKHLGAVSLCSNDCFGEKQKTSSSTADLHLALKCPSPRAPKDGALRNGG